MLKRNNLLICLAVAALSLICLASASQAQDGGWECGWPSPPPLPGGFWPPRTDTTFLDPTDNVPMVVIFSWMPDSGAPIDSMKPLPNWFSSYMSTDSLKSIPRFFKDNSYDPVLGGSHMVIHGDAYGDSNNRYYFRPDYDATHYDTLHMTFWAKAFHYDIIGKADRVIDFSRYVKNPNDPLDTVVLFCTFLDKDNARSGRFVDPAHSGWGASGLQFTYVDYTTSDMNAWGHKIILKSVHGSCLRTIKEWGVWPDEERRWAIGGGQHEIWHHIYPDHSHYLNDVSIVHTPEAYSWRWGCYEFAPPGGAGWGFYYAWPPWFRQVYGWGKTILVDTIRYRQRIPDAFPSGEMYRLSVPGAQQYFIVTNHARQEGLYAWEDTAKGRGLLIHHFDSLVNTWDPGNNYEMHRFMDTEGPKWDSSGIPSGIANADSGFNATHLWCRIRSPQDSIYLWTHGGNNGDSTFYFTDQYPEHQTIFDGLSNPNSNYYRYGSIREWWPPEEFCKQDSISNLAVYNIHQDPTDSTAMIADLLVNNWYGHITQNTTWGAGHYVITGDVTVDPGVKLTILPGTKIDFYPNVNNQINPPPFRPSGIFVSSNGKLTAIGTVSQPIIFRSNASLRGGTPSNSDWNGIYLGDGSIDTLKFCQISDCCSGIRSVYAGIAVIDSNTITNCQTYGILVTNARNQTGGVKVRRNRILNPAPVYGIYVERTNTSTPTAWQIAYNYIEMSTYGIYVNADSMADNALTIYRDTLVFTGPVGGGSVAGVHLEGTKKGVLIRRCRIVQGSGGTSGIQCANRVWPIIDSTKLVSTPDITGQRAAYGIYIDTPNASDTLNVTNIRRDSIGNFNTGVYVGNCSSNPPKLGINNHSTFWGLNNIVGCGTWNVYYWGYLPQPTMRAQANWWGSNPPNSNMFLGPVDYSKYKNGPISQPWICGGEGGGAGPQEGELVESLLPTHYELGQSYPNPANGELTIRYALPQEARVSLKVYNIAGQLVRNLVSEQTRAGYHSVRWDGKTESGNAAGSGVYFYRMDAGTFTSTKKLVLTR